MSKSATADFDPAVPGAPLPNRGILLDLPAGRLAQLVEHLVYTERVGGSSPSPPTRFGSLRFMALAAAFAVVGAALTPAAAQDHGPSMSFHVAPLEAHECGRHCPDVIVADGVIEAQTPE